MEIHIKKGLDALQTETVLRLLSQTVWACNRKKEAIMESWKHSICYGAYTADGKQIGFLSCFVSVYYSVLFRLFTIFNTVVIIHIHAEFHRSIWFSVAQEAHSFNMCCH